MNRSFELDGLLAAGATGASGAADHFIVAADHFEGLGQPRAALVALDRAYGLRPDDPDIAARRRHLLDAQAVVEHGMVFRYVPAGTFLMGSTTGDPDEQPVHPVLLDEYWIAEIPITWTRFCALMGLLPPPDGAPDEHAETDEHDSEAEPDDEGWDDFYLYQGNRVRMFYCDSKVESDDSDDDDDIDEDIEQDPEDYDRKPMIAVPWNDAERLGRRLSTARVRYELPSEAQWEKAARGGLIGQPYPWGSAPPDPSRCDCDHFGRWEIADPRSFPTNGYGLHGMSGGVWEWTRTIYDALAYRGLELAPDYAALAEEVELHRVLRGGSWADAAASVTVSFRHALIGVDPRTGRSDAFNPNVGFRLIRRAQVRSEKI